jgi:hypothetical protein
MSGDRGPAIAAVEAALKSGRIVQADRDRRIDQIKGAQSQTEIDMVVRDLLPPAPMDAPVVAPVQVGYGAPMPGSPATGLPTTQQIAQAMALARATGTTPTATTTATTATNIKIPKVAFLLPTIIGIVVIGAFAAGIFAFVGDAVNLVGDQGGGITDSRTYAPGIEPQDGINVLSVKGYQDLLGAIRDTSGGTVAFEAVLYPTYAVVELPVDDTSQRSNRFYWNGKLQSQESFDTSSEQRYDLSQLDPAVMVRLLKKVRALVESPTTWYAVIDAPDEDGAVLSVYASNAYSETAYLLAKPDGTITYQSVPTVTPVPEIESPS